MVKLKSDLHLHTRDDRFDTISHTAQELISTAAGRGFNVLSITNHDILTFSLDLKNYAADLGILLIPGIEMTIEGKHVLILNANSLVAKIKTFADLRRALQDDIFVIAPHPFFKASICLEEMLLDNLDLFHAVEFTFFYSKWVNFNREAIKVANDNGLPMVGNSDCHLLKLMGVCHSMIDADSQTVDAVFSAIRQHKVEVVSKPMLLPRLCLIHLEMKTKVSRSVIPISQKPISGQRWNGAQNRSPIKYHLLYQNHLPSKSRVILARISVHNL